MVTAVSRLGINREWLRVMLARGQMNRWIIFDLSPFAPENLDARHRFGRPFKPTTCWTWCLLADSSSFSRFPRRRLLYTFYTVNWHRVTQSRTDGSLPRVHRHNSASSPQVARVTGSSYLGITTGQWLMRFPMRDTDDGWMYVCIFIKLHITAQSGLVILVILCHSRWSSQGGINDTCMYVWSSHIIAEYGSTG